jgi:hypothetical protein
VSESEVSPDEPFTIYTLNDYYEAEIIKSALESEGIRCELDGERQAGLAEVLPIGITVRAKDADRARKIIIQHEERDR